MKTIAVIGYGSIGKRHAHNLRVLGAKVGVYDPDPAASWQAAADGFGAYSGIPLAPGFCAEVDAYVVAAPPRYHIPHLGIICKYSEAPVILVEKPLGATYEEAIGAVPYGATAKVLVGYNLRYCQSLQLLHTHVQDLWYGRPLHAEICCSSDLRNWRQTNSTKGYAADPIGGGVLLDISHEIDYMQWIFGMPRGVMASCRCTGVLGMPTEDMADMIWKYDTFDVAMHLDYHGPTRRYCRTQLEGTTIECNLDQNMDDTYVQEARALLACVDGASSPVPLSDGVAAMKLITAVRCSDKNKGTYVEVT